MIKKIIIQILGKFGYQLIKLKAVSQKEIEKHNKRGIEIINVISPNFIVLQGPFTGLKYPNINITEATLVPKITGSYESQLNSILEDIFNTEYTDIIDVGCAEGYYAVGFAINMPSATIHAFDINEKDIEFCGLMAKVNNANNITYNKFCSPSTLINFKHNGRLLVFCDAEGYELDLFTSEVVNNTFNTDFLIEMHDVLNPTISNILIDRFSKTHDIQIVNNRQTDLTQFYAKIGMLNDADKRFAVMEHRGGYNQNCFMEWAFMKAK